MRIVRARPGLAPFIAALCLFLAAGPVWSGELPKAGDRLPELVFQTPALPEDAEALGVAGKKTFTLADLGVPVVLIEVIGVYCAQCAKQAPLFNNLNKRLRRGSLKGKAAMLGLAAGGTPMEIIQLRQSGQYAYPILQDQDYALHKLLGEPKTPFTMIVTPEGEVLFAHLGYDDNVDEIYSKIKEAAAGNVP